MIDCAPSRSVSGRHVYRLQSSKFNDMLPTNYEYRRRLRGASCDVSKGKKCIHFHFHIHAVGWMIHIRALPSANQIHPSVLPAFTRRHRSTGTRGLAGGPRNAL